MKFGFRAHRSVLLWWWWWWWWASCRSVPLAHRLLMPLLNVLSHWVSPSLVAVAVVAVVAAAAAVEGPLAACRDRALHARRGAL